MMKLRWNKVNYYYNNWRGKEVYASSKNHLEYLDDDGTWKWLPTVNTRVNLSDLTMTECQS